MFRSQLEKDLFVAVAAAQAGATANKGRRSDKPGNAHTNIDIAFSYVLDLRTRIKARRLKRLRRRGAR